MQIDKIKNSLYSTVNEQWQKVNACFLYESKHKTNT